MQVLKNKKGIIVRLLIAASGWALLGVPAFAAPTMRSKRAQAQDPNIHHVVPQKCVPAKTPFNWNLVDKDLIDVLNQVADLTCKNIVVNDPINKNMKITIFGKAPLTPKDAWDLLLASLASKGLALIQQGKFWTVIKRNESKNYSTPFYSNAHNAADNEGIGTFFYKAEHAPPEALKNIARMLISKDGIVEIVGEQIVFVIDSNSNIRRLGKIFGELDIADAVNKIHSVKIENGDVKDVEKKVRELFDLGGSTNIGPPMGPPRAPRRKAEDGKSSLNINKVLADERTNTLIVVADLESFEKLKEVIKNVLDQPVSDLNSKGKIHVYRLRFGDADKIAETLNNVVKPSGRARSRFSRRDEESSELFEGDVQVTAHKPSNMIVAVASQNDYKSLLPTIMKLDVRRDQVYIEAAIMDIRINNDNDFGINVFSGIPGLPGVSLGFLANPGGRGIATGMVNSLQQNVAGTAASALNIPGQQALGALAVLNNFASAGVLGLVGAPLDGTNIPSFGAVLQALSTNSNVDILSTPYLLTSDNQEAVMKVGQKVPTVKGTSSVGGGTLGASIGLPMQNIAYEPVELSLKVTPHVGADNNIRLDIEQEVNELGNAVPLPSGNQNIIQTKSAKTSIVLRDQQTGVIGGLMHNKTNRTDTKIPFLGDIPLLGWLFKSRNTKNEKANLVLIITPYVIKSDDDYRKIVDKKLKEREEFANLYFGGKIKNYDPYVDYDKKSGPVSSMLMAVSAEMNKPENGGPGDGNETIIMPKQTYIEPPKFQAAHITDQNAQVQKEFIDEESEEALSELFEPKAEASLPAPEQLQLLEPEPQEPVKLAAPEFSEPKELAHPHEIRVDE